MVVKENFIWLKPKKLYNTMGHCCNRQKQRDCPRCSTSQHIPVNLKEKKTSLEVGFSNPNEDDMLQTEETTSCVHI